jgi:hypothetical protein
MPAIEPLAIEVYELISASTRAKNDELFLKKEKKQL